MFLKGKVLMNDSFVFYTKIGETYNRSGAYPYSRTLRKPPTSLQCITDKSPCCRTVSFRHGQWYRPNGAELFLGTFGSIYRDRADDGSVNLNRRDDAVVPPVGLYCCKIPDALESEHTLCANIGK